MTETLRLSQPNGVVITTSSKEKVLLAAVVMTTSGLDPAETLVRMDVTFVEKWNVARAKAVSATRARMALYVPATKRFSENVSLIDTTRVIHGENALSSRHSSSQQYFKLCFSIGSPT